MKRTPDMYKVKFILMLLIAIFLAACLPSPESTSTNFEADVDADDYSVLLGAVSDNVIIPAYQNFVDQTETWSTTQNSLSLYCDAIGSTTEDQALLTAQSDWKSAMGLWQKIEAFQIGPITDNAFDLRNRIYSWPDYTSTCTVDRNVVTAETTIDMGEVARQGRGLDVLEYLLFNQGMTHSCPSQIVETQGWNERNEASQKLARCQYAKQVADDVADNAKVLLNSWLPEAGGYRANLINSGADGGAFSSQEKALNALSDSLFYLSNDVKDRKVSEPIGISDDCTEFNCSNKVESPYSDNSISNIRNNVLGFRAIFTGSENTTATVTSFDDVLNAKNFPEISESIVNDVDALLILLDSLPQTFIDNVENINTVEQASLCLNAANNPDTSTDLYVCQIQGKIKKITDQLKGDFLTVISLTLPTRVEGDND